MSTSAESIQGKQSTKLIGEIKVTPSHQSMKRFECLKLQLDVKKEYGNPFDSKQVQVWAEFVSPSGRTITIKGYYSQPYHLESSAPDQPDTLQIAGPVEWLIKFTPQEEGSYQYRCFIRDTTGTLATKELKLVVSGATGHGFLRRDSGNLFYFRFRDGSHYLPVGYVYSFHRSKRLGDYEDHFRTMAANGCNWTYIILDPYDVSVEWGKRPPGTYDLQRCARLDYILEKAHQYGIMVLISFNVHADTMPKNEQGWGWWEEHPYNNDNGGPCPTGDDFFRMKEAKDLYKRKIDYIIARWGHYPNVMGWMPITEIEGSALWNPKSVDKDVSLRIAWYHEMAQHLKENDPYNHLVSVSLAGATLGQRNDDALFNDNHIDFVQIHLYLESHVAAGIEYWSQRHRNRYKKPVLVSEFGPSHINGFDKVYEFLKQDAAMLHHHDGVWASLFSGSAGTVMHWYWKSVEQSAGLDHLRAIRRFIDASQWPAGGYRTEHPLVPEWKTAPDGSCTDIIVTPNQDPSFMWLFGELNDTVSIHSSGRINNVSALRTSLFSQGQRKSNATEPLPKGMAPPRIAITCPKGAALDVTIGAVQGKTARVRISDAKKVLHEEAVDTVTLPYHIRVPLTAGTHMLVVENSDPGYSSVSAVEYRFVNCQEKRYAPLVVYRLDGEGEILLWMLRTDLEGIPVGAIPSASLQDTELVLPGISPGQYEIEWWDTYSGHVLFQQTADTNSTQMIVTPPPITRDIACRIIRKQPPDGETQ